MYKEYLIFVIRKHGINLISSFCLIMAINRRSIRSKLMHKFLSRRVISRNLVQRPKKIEKCNFTSTGENYDHVIVISLGSKDRDQGA